MVTKLSLEVNIYLKKRNHHKSGMLKKLANTTNTPKLGKTMGYQCCCYHRPDFSLFFLFYYTLGTDSFLRTTIS